LTHFGRKRKGCYRLKTQKRAYTTSGATDSNANGSVTVGDGRVFGWSVFNKPTSISKSGRSVHVYYGPNRSRYQRIDDLGNPAETTTHYVGSIEKIWRPNNVVETKRYLGGELIVTLADNAGTVSDATGGKFANGAGYAAFSMAVQGVASRTQSKDVPFSGEEAQIREFTEKEKQLNALLADPSQENLDRAVTIASDIYGIDVSNTKSFVYQADLGNKHAVAKASCMCVFVSDAGMASAGHFGSTLSHEVFHINKQFLGRSRLGIAKRYTRAWYQNEVEAYNHEISNQWRFGNSKKYLETLVEHRNGRQIDANNARY